MALSEPLQKISFEILWHALRYRKRKEIARVQQHLNQHAQGLQAKVVYYNLWRNTLDTISIFAKNQSHRIVYKNKHLWDALLTKPQPIVALSIHQGAFELLHRSLINPHKQVHVATAPLRPGFLNTIVCKLRRTQGITLYTPKHYMRHFSKICAQGGVLALLADQGNTIVNAPNIQSTLQIDGAPCPAFLHLPSKAVQKGASIILFNTYPVPNTYPRQHCIHFHTVLHPQSVQSDNANAITPTASNEKINTIIAQTVEHYWNQWIMEHPQQWAWNYHRLWNIDLPGTKA